MMTVAQILEAASKLSNEEQLALNKGLVEMIRSGRRVEQAIAGAGLKVGALAQFTCTKRNNYGLKTIKIESFNRARTCAVGWEVDKCGDRIPGGARWTVANTLLTLVG